MPGVHLSRYTNMVHGERYWDYISEELPEMLERWLPIANTREQRFVAGLSMGGWGTMKLALNQPERFAAAASLSGALWSAQQLQENLNDAERGKEFVSVFGDGSKITGSHDDLLYQVERHLNTGTKMPNLYACCGTEDHLLGHNRNMVKAMRARGLPITYEEGPGAHTWEFWDAWIQRALNKMGFDINPPDVGAVTR